MLNPNLIYQYFECPLQNGVASLQSEDCAGDSVLLYRHDKVLVRDGDFIQGNDVLIHICSTIFCDQKVPDQ